MQQSRIRLSRDSEKLQAWKNRQSVCHGWCKAAAAVRGSDASVGVANARSQRQCCGLTVNGHRLVCLTTEFLSCSYSELRPKYQLFLDVLPVTHLMLSSHQNKTLFLIILL